MTTDGIKGNCDICVWPYPASDQNYIRVTLENRSNQIYPCRVGTYYDPVLFHKEICLAFYSILTS